MCQPLATDGATPAVAGRKGGQPWDQHRVDRATPAIAGRCDDEFTRAGQPLQ